jgi:solute carrier family 13 (sodium-dependent dicarboxylate transporter), member 2/3/5
MNTEIQSTQGSAQTLFVWTARLVSIIGAMGIYALPETNGLSTSAQGLAAVTFLMAVLWMTEAAPVILTSLIPLLLFPLLEISDFASVLPVYVKDLIWLFFGGFQLAFAVERCGLHKRMAIGVLNAVGTQADRVVLGFMLASGLLSMWLFNTSTTLMLLPVAMAVVQQLDPDKRSHLGEACMLGLAYAASIGGTGTYLGTAPNGVFREQAATFGTEISFGNWMLFAMPLAIILILVVWLFLVRIALPIRGIKATEVDFASEISPTWSTAEKRVASIFAVTVFLWLSRGYISNLLSLDKGVVTDGRIAILSTIVLYLTAAGNGTDKLLTLSEVRRTPWSILVLFGGGFAIAQGFKGTGLSMWVGETIKVWVTGWPIYAVILVIVLMVTFLTEITSNTATANVLLPVIGSLAVATDTPVVLLMLPATLAASCAFMMPVATPPNAIVYGSKMVSIKRMASVGFGINILTAVAITAWTLTWGKLVLPQ